MPEADVNHNGAAAPDSRWPDFASLLPSAIDPQTTVVMRHAPQETRLKRALPTLAAEYPVQFDAYQSIQGERVARDLRRARHLASFIGHKPRHALFVGIFEVGTAQRVTREEWHARPGVRAILDLGCPDWEVGSTLFELTPTNHLAAWQGKLAVQWPKPEIRWWRWAAQSQMPITAIHEEAALTQAVPQWDELNLSLEELRAMPSRLREALAQWRAIYYIYDVTTRRGYVGSAYGAQNLRRRWEDYPRNGHGGNKLLKAALEEGSTKAEDLRFTILQRLSPDLDSDDVIRLENSWMERLHTRAPSGFNASFRHAS
ncbi:MAG TPA: GIY-YIG nuclease family protein [Mesorhizobium sp.]|jgi:hypothetical protein|nr:GIY-YIG nuclease family protein [Mesorhizobium sp.]